MTPRMVATAAAVTSFIFGAAGLAVPTALASGFGIGLDPTGVVLARLACASYVGFRVHAWLARDLTDPDAWRAVAAAQSRGCPSSPGVRRHPRRRHSLSSPTQR